MEPQDEAPPTGRVPPPPLSTLGTSGTLFGASGLAVLGSSTQTSAPPSGAWSARTTSSKPADVRREEDEADEALARQLRAAEAQFFRSQLEKDSVVASRQRYPRKKPLGPVGVDELTGEEADGVKRRVMGFGLGFEKIFATTSIRLPLSAYTMFAELHVAHNHQVFLRVFNGMHTIFDLKKWVYEKILVPSSAYDLSYAEAGKTDVHDSLRLLTMQDSLDTRTFATTRVAHGKYTGIPGVHSIDDIGVTRLYLRLKCRTCGDLLTSLQSCRKFRKFGDKEPYPETQILTGADVASSGSAEVTLRKVEGCIGAEEKEETEQTLVSPKEGGEAPVIRFQAGVPGADPNIEDMWYRPDKKKHCLFHGRGFEYFQGARTHGGASELARIYISCGKEPSKKLRLQNQAFTARAGPVKISY